MVVVVLLVCLPSRVAVSVYAYVGVCFQPPPLQGRYRMEVCEVLKVLHTTTCRGHAVSPQPHDHSGTKIKASPALSELKEARNSPKLSYASTFPSTTSLYASQPSPALSPSIRQWI
ncbi:hypothetical protein E2C01_092854 [Portunus trituberculatus]|uniref:Secreted protein n=1 Tax=Portunus trituberculatus TaxID=210409 RepID=A0A5B7JSI7_PORTR|nr:hypothetical protein [Portunus trituberculatus]